VTSTLDGLAARSHLIHWQAFPSGPSFDVSEVDYLIDGKQLWVEHNAPYFYRDDGNYLVTSFLKPGKHVLHRAGGRLGRAGRHRLGDRRCLSGALTARRAGGHLEAWQSAGGTPAGYAPLVISAHCGRGWSEGQFPFTHTGDNGNLEDVAHLSLPGWWRSGPAWPRATMARLRARI
jgi:hypothetical protein